MLALVQELERQDPEAEVSLLIELSPRHFSRAYADKGEWSRPMFAELARADSGSASFSVDELRRKLARWIPVYRHRARFAAARSELETPARRLAGPTHASPDAAERRVEGRARLSVHYRDLQLDAASVQVQALQRIVERCLASGRRLRFFTVPLEDEFAASLGPERRQGEDLAQLDALLAPDGERVALLPMDHPLFRSQLVWDHVHLRPEGHQLLAINLLHQLDHASLTERIEAFVSP